MAEDPRSEELKQKLRGGSAKNDPDPREQEGVLEALEAVKDDLPEDASDEEVRQVTALIFLHDITVAQMQMAEALSVLAQAVTEDD